MTDQEKIKRITVTAAAEIRLIVMNRLNKLNKTGYRWPTMKAVHIPCFALVDNDVEAIEIVTRYEGNSYVLLHREKGLVTCGRNYHPDLSHSHPDISKAYETDELWLTYGHKALAKIEEMEAAFKRSQDAAKQMEMQQ